MRKSCWQAFQTSYTKCQAMSLLVEYCDNEIGDEEWGSWSYLGQGALTQTAESAAAISWDTEATNAPGQQGDGDAQGDAGAEGQEEQEDEIQQPALSKRQSLVGVQGLTFHAQIVRDDYVDKKHCLPSGELKPRRPLPQVRERDFFSKLVLRNGAWVVRDPLNGWPALCNLEVRSVTGKTRFRRIERVWSAEAEAAKPLDQRKKPFFPSHMKYVRVSLRGDPWTAHGWAPDSKGFAFWFHALRPKPLLVHGQHMLKEADPSARISRAHLLSHRYAKKRESPKDLLTYHSAVVLEWNHGRHCTVVELAWLNGLGGYGGRSNWCLDLKSVNPPPALRTALPPEMIQPWRNSMAELRVVDHPARNIDEFKKFVEQHTGTDKRFLSPDFSQSCDVALSHNSEVSHYAIVLFLLEIRIALLL